MDYIKVLTLIIEDAPKFVALAKDFEGMIEDIKDPHEKNFALEVLDMIEDIIPKMNTLAEDIKAFMQKA